MMRFNITTLEEYIKEVDKSIEDLKVDKAENNEILLFRGQPDEKYELLPSIGRGGRRFAAQYSILDEERNLIDMARYRLPNVFKDTYRPLETLALLQHFGIPTRLLDVTENALIALYFACVEKADNDGEVFVFKSKDKYITTFPIIDAISDSYRFAFSTVTNLSDF